MVTTAKVKRAARKTIRYSILCDGDYYSSHHVISHIDRNRMVSGMRSDFFWWKYNNFKNISLDNATKFTHRELISFLAEVAISIGKIPEDWIVIKIVSDCSNAAATDYIDKSVTLKILQSG